MLIDQIKNFSGGGMDTDSAYEYVDINSWITAYNCRVIGTTGSEEGYVTNPESNTLIPSSRPNGINKGIGGKAFEDIRQIVMFIYNSAGFHQLAIYDADTATEQVIYTDKTDSDGIPLLTLDPKFYVNCVLVNKTYLVWADGISEVGYVNLKTLASGGYGTVLAEDLSLIKPQPLIPITGSYASDLGKASNFVKGKLFQFIPQWVNADFNSSTWGTWSKRIVPIQESTPSEGTNVSENNCIVVNVDIGSIRATQLNVACRYGLLDFNIIKTVDRAYIVALFNTTVDIENQIFEAYNPATNIYSFVFYNENLNIPVPPTETDQFVDYIWPSTAIEKINGNIIALGDLKVGYERPTTSVTLNVSGYDPNLTVPTDPTTDPLRIYQVYGDRPYADHKTVISLSYAGIPHTGDKFKIVLYNNGNVTQTWTYEYTVLASQDGNLVDAVQAFAATLDGAYVQDISGSNTILKLTFIGPPFSNLQSASVTLFNEGPTVSKSIHAILDNSSYQLALSYRDKWGRPFPLETGNTFIANTPSFAQLQGLTPQISWNINDAVAPVGAVDYQWLITKNTTTIGLLDVMGNVLDFKGAWNAQSNTPTLAANTGTVGDTYQITGPNDQSDPAHLVNLGNGTVSFNTGDYVSYNGKSWDVIPKSFADLTSTANIIAIKINPLGLFNQRYSNNGVNTILNYDYTAGDRCTIHYVIDGGVKEYQNNPCIDLDVYGYDPSTFLVKVQKSSAIDPADLVGKDIFIRLYTPNTQQASNQTEVDNTTVWFEIGERFTITNGNHDVLSGNITDGDVYFKTRSYDGAVDPDTLYNILATDFNFSDFYQSNYTSYGRGRTYYDILEKTEQQASIITSQNYILGSKNNGLNRFYQENIYGDSDGQTSSSFGSIQVLWQRNDYLVVIQELHVGYIPVNVTIYEDQTGKQEVAISQKLLNNIRYNETGNIGIGLAKESFCFKDNNGYFVDPNRSEPMRIGLDGIIPISGKMSKFFKATLQLAYAQGKKLVMYYNMFYDEVMLCIEAEGGVLTLFPFNDLNWQAFDDYNIDTADVTYITEGTHSSFSFNSVSGILTITPDSGYVGNDSMQFTFNVDGNPVTKNICLNWIAGTTNVNPFSFTSLTGQDLNTVVASNQILVGGNNVPVPISIVGGEYSINGAAFTSTPGMVNAGALVQVRLTTANALDTTVTATLTISSTAGIFSAKTKVEVTINYAVTQQANPFASSNLRIKQNGSTVATQNGTGTGSVNVIEGDTISIEAFGTLFSTGGTPLLNLTNEKDSVEFYNQNTPDTETASLISNFTAEDATYDSTVISSATGASGYAIANHTGATVPYDIYDGSSVLTSSGTLANNAVLNIQTLITGGDNSEIRFKAPSTGTYNFQDPPTGTGSTAGAITSGNVFLDYTVANIATEVGLGNVGRIVKLVP